MLNSLLKWRFDPGREHELRILHEVPLFKGLKLPLLRKLLTDLYEKEYAAGETVFSAGDAGKALYVVMSGAVKIVRPSEQDERVLTTLGPGSYFGELALIKESPRYATAVITENARLLIMYKSYFDSLIRGNSSISSLILMNLAESLSDYISSNRCFDDNERK